ncbi:CCA tRNA nucleotidyltransferase [Aquamicrobium segne]|uniref:CCA tRNA nucleotidyltransferase n=1 Tax=Aquamicrobium segne TaxID=469547 RepID=A0ABW0GYV0_9HYPH
MSDQVSIAGCDWLAQADLQRLLSVLSEGGEQARIAGGAVRNALLGQMVADIDIATTTVPQETMKRAIAAGFKVAPTGIDHGTVTVIAGGTPFEVTTLRADIETDGRHASVVFGRDWKADAERRDFTINGLYAKADGTVIDLVGGLADIKARQLRFIGDPQARIREDYLRILRFFRFFAWYGHGRPDAEGLKACVQLKDGLDRLSVERVWAELKKLLSAPDPSRALLWMRQAGVLSHVLPESEKWGIDSIHGLVRAQMDLDWPIDAMLRLESILPPDAARLKDMAKRLRLSRAQTERLQNWALAPSVRPDTSERALSRQLYTGNVEAITDRLRLALSAARARAVGDDKALVEAGGYFRQLRFVQGWDRPDFPVKGADLKGLGLVAGPKLGALLKQLEQEWIDSNFMLGREALLARAAEVTGPQT